MAWWELVGMLGGSLDEGLEGTTVTQQSLSQLLAQLFPFANKTVANSDHLGLGEIDADDMALMGPALVAQRAVQPVTTVVVEETTSNVGSSTSLLGQIPLPPPVGFFTDPDDPILFANPPKDTVYHAQIGVVPRAEDFDQLSEATEVRIQKFFGHPENLSIVRDWTLLMDLKSGIVWDFYLRADIPVGYRVQFRGAGTTEWSKWHFQNLDGTNDLNFAPAFSTLEVAKPGRNNDPNVIV